MSYEEEDPIEEENLENELTDESESDGGITHDTNTDGGILPVSGLYENWFLDYASYVILERAVPDLNDGLKPVQRRILHAMKEMDDGRYNKVANIIGQTMQYHPHGDAAIGEAIVNLGQKELLIDTQGNWGDIRTGDSAAASRYIEARLTPFALEVIYNPQTTTWVNSYDGRKKEPLHFPVKFPLVLAQGVEGIAVGLATKIMPHNFRELCQASVDVLKGKKTHILPDFLTGGMADFSNYNSGMKGGKIRVRARIEQAEGKRLLIKEIPFGTTTGSLIDSIIKANDNGKIKIRKVIDNTAREVEIEIQLMPGISPEMTIDALYAFTDCEISISPSACVIVNDKPMFLSVDEMLEISTRKTVELLEQELKIKLGELNEKWHFSSLEKIFIEERIYRDIEECETWDEIIQTIDKGLEPFKSRLKREVTVEDITKLTEIRIKRISKFDSFKADELLIALEKQIEEILYNLEHLVEFAIDYFENLLKKYGKGKERRTEIRLFDTIEANVVAVANEKLYANFAEGFVGIGLKKDEYITDCSDIDDIIAFRRDGKYQISKVADKQFMGKDLIHVDVFRKNDDRKVYNVVYLDGKSKAAFVKRFNVSNLIRDKEYDVTMGTQGSKILYFTANYNSEAEKIGVYLSSLAKAKKKFFEYNFAELTIKGRNSRGNTLTRHPIRKIEMTEKGISTERGRDVYYEIEIGRLNTDGRGEYLGSFTSEDKILAIFNDGSYELTDNELTNKYDGKEIALIQKFNSQQPINVVHYDPDAKATFVKRFKIETTTLGRKFLFISEGRGAKLLLVSTFDNPEIEYSYKNERGAKVTQKVMLADFIDVKGWKALGNKLSAEKLTSIKLLSPLKPEIKTGSIEKEETAENEHVEQQEEIFENEKNETEENNVKTSTEEVSSSEVETEIEKKTKSKKEVKTDTQNNQEKKDSLNVIEKTTPKLPEVKMTVIDTRTKNEDDDIIDSFGQKSLFDL
ncbi:MAG: DNA gyrase/topoisomerase IV subunit A [Bacteroidetes bacterium]|nr:DNA gyrase/topoisomerase IV subunit A [Bacteroidota bacterium]